MLRPISAEADRLVLKRHWQLYRHDLSEFRDMHLDNFGLFTAGRMPSYFSSPNRCGYFIDTDTQLASFVLVSGVVDAPRRMGEFFVIRPARRCGVGSAAVRAAMQRHPAGERSLSRANHHAARFSRTLAAAIDPAGHREQLRPIPGKPHLPPDVLISFNAP